MVEAKADDVINLSNSNLIRILTKFMFLKCHESTEVNT